jgi:hypothetical protein
MAAGAASCHDIRCGSGLPIEINATLQVDWLIPCKSLKKNLWKKFRIKKLIFFILNLSSIIIYMVDTENL